MKLYKITIHGFRRICNAEIFLGDATFLIGSNNVGKSSVLYALDYLLGANSSIPIDEFYALEEEGKRKIAVENIVFTAEFRRIPREANFWRGF